VTQRIKTGDTDIKTIAESSASVAGLRSPSETGWTEAALVRISTLLAGLFALSCEAFVPSLVRADKPDTQHSYRMFSSNQAYVFIMLPPGDKEEFPEKQFIEEFAREIRSIRAQYSQSGVYRNDGSRIPLWTVDWYSFRVYLASDGVHLVREGDWPSDYATEAISFFAHGKLLRTYRINELVADPRLLPHSVSHFQWLESGSIDDNDLTFTVLTKAKTKIIFDLKTGAILSGALSRPAVSSDQPWPWSILAIAGAGLILGGMVVWRMRALYGNGKNK
jgi:hypothetical protein